MILSRVASSQASPPSSLPFLFANNFIPRASSVGLSKEEIQNEILTLTSNTSLASTYWSWIFILFIENHDKGFFKNRWPKTRLVCHLGAFFTFYPNMVRRSVFLWILFWYLNFDYCNLLHPFEFVFSYWDGHLWMHGKVSLSNLPLPFPAILIESSNFADHHSENCRS